MRTTIDVDPKLLDEVVRATGQKTKSKAVGKAIEEYLMSKAYNELLALAGTMEFEEDWNIWRRTDLGNLRAFEIDGHGATKSRSD